MSELWTIEQLPDQVADLLSDNYDGQSNGRVRELPNRRTIRWYTTIGLVDRPAATRGRTVLYGRRHLLQIVAVKKLQASGSTLAEIQELLLGATDARLAELAGVAHVDAVRPQVDVGTSQQFWKGHAHGRAAITPDFGLAAPIADAASRSASHTAIDTVTKLVQGVRLGDSVTVMLDAAGHPPTADEIAAIEAAAAPLLDLLGRLGLAPTTRPGSPVPGTTAGAPQENQSSALPAATAALTPDPEPLPEQALADRAAEPRPRGETR